ncbi:aspartate--tRNA ligase [Arthrobacter sp. Hiyo8]|nr:aspartate--tRNA ligase [Arthrobacter sp. Hiyo8]
MAFVDLRDASGVAQVVVREEEVFHGLRNEYVLQIVGTVSKRPEGNENPHLATGEIEVIAEKVVILNTSDPLPFQIDEHVEVGEEARLKHRYLDLRRPAPPGTCACVPKRTAWPASCFTSRVTLRSRLPR